MGRKGGGRSGFVKAARSAAHADGADEQQTAAPVIEQQPAASAAQPTPSKAAKFLKTEEPEEAGSSSDEEGEPGVEMRGKMLQRHKRVSKWRQRRQRRQAVPLVVALDPCINRCLRSAHAEALRSPDSRFVNGHLA